MMKTHIAFERYLNIRSAYTPAWLSDDQRIAFLSDISGTPQVWAVDSTGGWPDQLTFLQDKVWTLDVSSGSVTYLEDLSCDLESLAVSPDGRTLAFTVNENGYSKLYLHDLDSKSSKPVTGLFSGITAEPAFSKNGTYLAVSVQGPRHNLNIWTVDTVKPTWLWMMSENGWTR